MSDDKSICRDFERGVCNRGSKCKFKHSEEMTVIQSQKLPICKDFQNKGCDRVKCKFLHITNDEESDYMRTGVLPSHGGHPTKQINPASDICKDFLNNICQRGSRCKFRHVLEEGYQVDPIGAGRVDISMLYGKRRRDEFAELMEENEMLRRKITDLQRQVLDLRQMNDTLYDQNTRYRNQLRSHAVSDAYGSVKSISCTSVTQSPEVSRSAYDTYGSF